MCVCVHLDAGQDAEQHRESVDADIVGRVTYQRDDWLHWCLEEVHVRACTPPDSLAAAPLHTTPQLLSRPSTLPPPAFLQDGAELVLHLAAVVHQRGAHTVSQGAAH